MTHTSSWREPVSSERIYRLRGVDKDLNISEFASASTSAPVWGWFLRGEVMVDQAQPGPEEQFSWGYVMGYGATAWGWTFDVTPDTWHPFWTYVAYGDFSGEAFGGVAIRIEFVGNMIGQMAHFRRFRADFGFDPGDNSDPGYYDGDSTGWEWVGPAHNSESRDLTGTGRNLFVNPTFHDNADDGWGAYAEGFIRTHETDAMGLQTLDLEFWAWTGQDSDKVDIQYPPYMAITSFYPDAGPETTQVALIGHSLSDVTIVKFFDDVSADTFTVDSDGHVTVTVPVGATTGPIYVEGPTGSCSSLSDFTVTE